MKSTAYLALHVRESFGGYGQLALVGDVHQPNSLLQRLAVQKVLKALVSARAKVHVVHFTDAEANVHGQGKSLRVCVNNAGEGLPKAKSTQNLFLVRDGQLVVAQTFQQPQTARARKRNTLGFALALELPLHKDGVTNELDLPIYQNAVSDKC